jgi:hypothetical protein
MYTKNPIPHKHAGGLSLHHDMPKNSGPHSAPFSIGIGRNPREQRLPKCDADHSYLSAEVKNLWIFTSMLLLTFKVM